MGYKNLSTSRGDGNLFNSVSWYFLSGIRTYLPREGTETESESHFLQIQGSNGIRIYPPREGTETIQVSHKYSHLNHKEDPTHLERGRKPLVAISL